MATSPREGYNAEWNEFEKSAGDLLPFPPGHPDFDKGYNETLAGHARTFPPPLAGITTKDEQISERVKVRVYLPPTSGEEGKKGKLLPLAVFFHGGGWISGDLDSEDYLCRRVCGDVEIIVVSVLYRKGPGFQYPELIDDCYEGFQWAYTNASVLSADTTRYLLWGGSSGGGLAISLTHKLALTNERHKLAGLICVSSVALHPAMIPPEYAHLHTSHTDRDVPFVYGDMLEIPFQVLKCEPPYNEEARHLFPAVMGKEGVEGFPPTWIVNCGKEMMRDDGAVLEAELRDARVRVKRECHEGLPHYYWCFPLPVASERFRKSLVEGIKWVLNGE